MSDRRATGVPTEETRPDGGNASGSAVDWVGRGMADAEHGRFADSWACLSHAARARQPVDAALAVLALSLAQAGDMAPALDVLRAAIAQAPEADRLWYFLGELLRSLDGHGQPAASALRRAVLLQPENGAAQAALAETAFMAGDFHSAQAVVRSAQAMLAPYDPVRQSLERAGSVVPGGLSRGLHLFTRLTPDPRLPHNAPEYDETYHLDHVIGHGDSFWAVGPLFDGSEGSATGFAYSSDRRFFTRFLLQADPGKRSALRLLPGDFYKRMDFGFRPWGQVVWESGNPPDVERLRGLVDDGQRFALFLDWGNGTWSRHPVTLLYCYRGPRRILIRSAVMQYPSLLHWPIPALGHCFEAFCSQAARRTHLDSGSWEIPDHPVTGCYTIDSDGGYLAPPMLDPARRNPPSRVVLLCDTTTA